VGELTSFVLMSVQTGFSAVSIGPGVAQIYSALGATDRIFEIIDMEEKIEPSIPTEVFEKDLVYRKMWVKDTGNRKQEDGYERLLDIEEVKNKQKDIKSGEIEFRNVKFN